ncbi:T9SS type A sorting domain-containing protein [Tamlana sp. 2_MG-2023]|uniref:T9SS type A sorting domain-containing protein n=1 Tax=unclassified Tamlana TaxID=2614803 RepID=UPI0026E24AC9|nr:MULTISPECIES: T9SS type A sorting domain-containing protein [unclassified Tamlana]MDO6760463.1 T9SS type A sorting domain-containing protein [Tamlana sp. 2_MG-2023]MDO6790719.1 T9SS type A sorting domain-containing protein [Tamlana sp. 1_MG-2023]
MTCTSAEATDWQKFKFSINDVSFQNQGSEKYISSADENYMICNRTAVDFLEKFEIIGQIGNGNVISIKGSNGKYVSSENGTKTMTCNRSSIGEWEKFTLEGSNGVYALKGSNGLYVRNDMTCTSAEATDWQKFKITEELKSSNFNKTSDSNKTLVVYSNQANSQLLLSGIPDGSYDLKIYNMQGRLVKNTNIRISEHRAGLNIDALSTGLYILKLNNNDVSKTVKFIKE